MRYAIVSTPRTGSSVLCDCLDQTGVAGMVSKERGGGGYELRIGLGEEIKNNVNGGHIERWFRQHFTPNGVSATKVMFPYVLTMVRYAGWDSVDRLLLYCERHIRLVRLDKLAQAVSLYVAQNARAWSSRQKRFGKFPNYSYKGLASCYTRIMMGEAYYEAWYRAHGIHPLVLHYEDCREDWKRTCKEILDYLEIQDKPKWNWEPRLKRLFVDEKEAMLDRFRKEWTAKGNMYDFDQDPTGPREPCPECGGDGVDVTTGDDGKLYFCICPYCDGSGSVLRCFECGQPLQLVRPGKWQCPECG